MVSHLGQGINDHVILKGIGSQSNWAVVSFQRITADGTATDFQVPSDKLLVVTDVEWQVSGFRLHGGPGDGWWCDFHPGDAAWLVIRSGGHMVFGSRTTRVVSQGPVVGTSEQLTTGFVIGSRGMNAFVQVQPHYEWPSDFKIIGFVGDLSRGFLVLRGYLIDAPAIPDPGSRMLNASA